MGSAACAAVDDDPELRLVSRVDRGDRLDLLTEAGTEVAVEFTDPGSVKDNTLFCLSNKIDVVVGATGLTPSDLSEIEGAARAAGARAFVAPNFALGAVLMMKFAAEAARHYATAEIIERHHEQKLDAPSGTALRTADLMREARSSERDVPIHSVRLPGLVAHQEVVFGAPGETLTIKHDSIDRASFMPGVLLAIKRVRSLPPLTVGLENLLDG